MSEAEHVVSGLIEAVIDGDLDGVLSRVADDLVVNEPEGLTYGGIHRGKRAFQDDVIGAIYEKAAMRVASYRMLPAGDTVAVHMELVFTANKTGKQLEMPYVELYTVTDGLVSSIDVYPKDTRKLRGFWDEN